MLALKDVPQENFTAIIAVRVVLLALFFGLGILVFKAWQKKSGVENAT
ncbi:MAG: hypothetical protein NC823_02780 [Candidatus Omnitrophica bacterium]|nr:hypothetical protein [Candidatus Omnitrophota bacterium]